MSGIYISGMEMPKTWRDCMFSNGAAQCKLDKMELCGLCYRQRCPLIPVPDHGRLVDADELREDWLEKGKNGYVYGTNSFLYSLDNAPTIIPASKEDT